ncbi:MAG: hypothetical protein WDN31_17875 [Hyphomicrobium sp.]
MRSVVTKMIAAAALLSPLAFNCATAEAQQMGPTIPPPPSQQQAQPQPQLGPAAPAVKAMDCPGNPNPLGVARVVEIDTHRWPRFRLPALQDVRLPQPEGSGSDVR